VTDRLKDVIKSGGEWIASIDMENPLLSHPAIAEAAVVGLQHPQGQERPFVVVAPQARSLDHPRGDPRDREPDPEDERGQVRQEGHPCELRRRLRRCNGPGVRSALGRDEA